MNPLTHFDAQGQAHMVDVAAKAATHRVAVASGRIEMLPATLALIEAGNAKKGDVLGIARIAAIQATKRAAELIPLCHPIALTRVNVELVVPLVVTSLLPAWIRTSVEVALRALVSVTVHTDPVGMPPIVSSSPAAS